MTYISPNTLYQIEPVTQKRVTEFVDGQPVWTEYTQFNIIHDGEVVQFCFNEEDIEETIRFFEKGDNIDPIYFTGLTAG